VRGILRIYCSPPIGSRDSAAFAKISRAEGSQSFRYLQGLSMAVPVRGAVALMGCINNGKYYPQNARKIYADKNIVENHVGRLSVNYPQEGGLYAFGSGYRFKF